MDELLEQFLIESRDLVAQASDDFASLARNPQNTASLNSAFRAIHTLKGSVALFDMAAAEQLLHAAEDVLDRARKGTAILDAPTVAALVTGLDQTDRWIDQIERASSLGEGASGIAEKIIALLTPVPTLGAMQNGPSNVVDDGWVAALLAREADHLAKLDQPLTAFRYVPDADCFFRGDDPLAVVASVPDLIALSILPNGGAWPLPDETEPFSCFTILEGLSTSPRAVVSAAFRMMPDQASFATIDQSLEQGRPQERATRGNQLLRVDISRVDALGDALGELLVAVNRIAPLASEAAKIDPRFSRKLRAVQADMDRVTDRFRETLSAVRAVPLEPSLRRLPRLAREIAESLGKAVQFQITGQDIEVDKQIADGLFEPLLHLVRNAIDHGIESNERRAAAGKHAAGKISLDFSREGDTIVARLSDDGAGIDAAHIRQVAIERGVINAEAAENLAEPAILRLIFAPGFSTATEVTELSGRGVGMDVVQNAIVALRGTIDIDSVAGKGTSFSLRLPANALTTRLLVVEAGGDRYGVALEQVIETVGLENDKLIPIGSGLACVLHGRTVPVLSLAALLGGRDTDLTNAKLLVTQSSGELVALRVDGFGERIDALVRRSSGMLASMPGVTGFALLGDGGVLLVLDLPELAA